MAFEYKNTGLPDNPKWQNAAKLCKAWLDKNMSMFGDHGIESFMNDQPVKAAMLIMTHCPDYSEESITLALLGPARMSFMQSDRGIAMIEQMFGARTAALMQYIEGVAIRNGDANMPVDAKRLFLVEGLSTMNDQIIGRKRIDRHHQVRWDILMRLEHDFKNIRGDNPALDNVFAYALKQSREALEILDANAKNGNKGPKPPQP